MNNFENHLTIIFSPKQSEVIRKDRLVHKIQEIVENRGVIALCEFLQEQWRDDPERKNLSNSFCLNWKRKPSKRIIFTEKKDKF